MGRIEMNKAVNLAWHLVNKGISLPFYLAGLGAARDLSKGAWAALEGAYRLPIDFAMGVVVNEGVASLAKGTANLLLGVGQSVIENTLGTLALLAAGVVVGKGIAWKSERLRQYKRDEAEFKENMELNK
ncbi:MAG TPA: hypothetical protein QF533_09235 [Nitrospinota bacterium]|nr:hypothetical protein [Nitrospinota bacterium]HJP14506.1 hypothetical protein [Nitrospinota bacterium]